MWEPIYKRIEPRIVHVVVGQVRRIVDNNVLLIHVLAVFTSPVNVRSRRLPIPIQLLLCHQLLGTTFFPTPNTSS